MNGEFLKLLNLVESGRECNGQDSFHVSEEQIATALEIDQETGTHLSSDECRTEADGGCIKCAEFKNRRIVLRERLNSEGHPFPTEVFDSM